MAGGRPSTSSMVESLPTTPLCAMNQVSQDIILAGDDLFPVMPADYGKFMVISLGCGSNRDRRYSAKAAGKWGVFSWLFKDGNAPIIDMFNSASADMVDIHLCVLFRALRSSQNYLRIQYDQLTGSAGSIDDTSKENMDRLVRIGNKLLDMNVSRVDLETGRIVEVPGAGTNADQLAKFAKQLSDERRRRQNELVSISSEIEFHVQRHQDWYGDAPSTEVGSRLVPGGEEGVLAAFESCNAHRGGCCSSDVAPELEAVFGNMWNSWGDAAGFSYNLQDV